MFLAGLLDAGGLEVRLITREERLEALLGGYLIRRPDRPMHVQPRVATVGSSQLGSFDVIFLAVKAFAVEPAVPDIKRLLSDHGRIVAIQNGVGSDVYLAEAFGSHRVTPATLTLAVDRTDEGVRQYGSAGGFATTSEGLQGRSSDSRLLEQTGLPVQYCSSGTSLRWSKLLLNLVGSAQSAILDEPVSTVTRHTSLFAVERLMILEAVDAISTAAIELTDLPGFRVQLFSKMMRMPSFATRPLLGRRIAGSRGSRRPGLSLDVRRGGPTENRFINGAVVKLAAEQEISTPVNSALTVLVDEVTQSPELRAQLANNIGRYREELRARLPHSLAARL
jgi:2-dehydropantoate 2-reductase